MSLLESCLPLHPTVALVVSALFRRFAQNERSLFALLNSSEPHGLQDFLANQTYDGRVLPTFTLSNLYDYIHTALGSSLYTSREGSKWAEIESAIERLPDPSPMTVKLIKTIGLLSIVGEASVNLKASKALLRYALDDEMERSHNEIDVSCRVVVGNVGADVPLLSTAATTMPTPCGREAILTLKRDSARQGNSLIRICACRLLSQR